MGKHSDWQENIRAVPGRILENALWARLRAWSFALALAILLYPFLELNAGVPGSSDGASGSGIGGYAMERED